MSDLAVLQTSGEWKVRAKGEAGPEVRMTVVGDDVEEALEVAQLYLTSIAKREFRVVAVERTNQIHVLR